MAQLAKMDFRDVWQIKVVPKWFKKSRFDFDTEQDEADQQYNVTILKRAVIYFNPDNLLSYNIRQPSMNEYKP